MGQDYSKLVKKRHTTESSTLQIFHDITPGKEPLAATSISTSNPKNTPNTDNSTNVSPSSNSQIGSSKKYELKAAHVNTLVAKTWNPNDPKSWESEMRGYHSLPNSDYLLPNDAEEQGRLEMQHYIYRAAFEGDIVCPAVKDFIKTPGYKLLDVGCAKGFWLNFIKKENPSAECHGVDISEILVEQSSAEVNGLFLKFGNVLETLPYEDNTFDFVHQRLLVLGMPREKFPDALKELIRVTKPGGWIELVEMDVVIYNAGPFSQTLTTAFFDGLHRRGLDCYAATNLPFYVKQVAENVENQQEKLLKLPMGWDSRMGILLGADLRAASLGMEDWLHKAMGLSRDEYRQLVQSCYLEWPVKKSFAQVRALYFQVKK